MTCSQLSAKNVYNLKDQHKTLDSGIQMYKKPEAIYFYISVMEQTNLWKGLKIQ